MSQKNKRKKKIFCEPKANILLLLSQFMKFFSQTCLTC